MNHDKKAFSKKGFKQQFTGHIKMTIKSKNLKYYTDYFFNDMINLKELEIC